jgi:hypothetical protein
MTKKFASDSPTFEEIKRLRKPTTRDCELFLDNELKAQRRQLLRDIEKAKRLDEKENRNPEAPGMQKQLEALDEEIKSLGVTFVFQDLGRKRYEDLATKHRPTPSFLKEHLPEEEATQWLEQYPEAEFYPPTFNPALVAAALVSPELSKEQIYELWDEFSQGDTQLLFVTALLAQTDTSTVNFSGNDTGEIRALLSSLTTAANEDSPIPGS